ncbi:hypothetical protein BKE38_25780 [Pseudoroseomonas deserti]|uniref:Uncharacterized protein n=1 Tax=Teichococcus deserti TaxID=1817963 RepID=A0A1V2GX07_9PROT|nr:hypothetical protein [Pseudoroseomonas deserti]ONG46044.1 hypothetical protein BKE38_25780 [Pseudoroseomonas deserti]
MTTPVRLSALLLAPLVLATTALAQEDGWSRFLPETAPGIAACLEGEAGAAATAALPMNHGRVLVRITRRDGDRLECVAELGVPGTRARREQSRSVGAAPPLPGEDAQRLSLAPLCPGATPVPQAAGLFLNPPGCR